MVINVDPYGYQLYLPPKLRHHGSTGIYILRSYYDPAFAHIGSVLRAGDVFIDGGANLGIYTCAAATIVGPSGRVLSFEPSDYAFPILERNIALNSFRNVRAFKVAISDQAGRSKLYHVGNSPVNYSLAKDIAATFDEIDTETIDESVLKSDLDRVDLIKLDVEGAEKIALLGARKTIDRFNPKILIEVDDEHASNLGASTDEVRKLLEEHDYRFYMWDETGNIRRSAWPQHAYSLLAVHSSDAKFSDG